jgi:predicted metal-dependent phosphoesterase TrpH
MAERKRLDAIAITDHNSLRSFSLPPSSNVRVIPGCEYATDFGDITGLFNTTSHPYRDVFKLIDHLRQEKALVVLVHPFRGNHGGRRLLLDVAEQSDLIEVWNPRSPLELNRQATKLAHDLDKPVLGGSDAHSLKEIGSTHTVLGSFRPSESLSNQLLRNPRRLVVSVTPASEQRVSRIIRALREYDYLLASRLAFLHCTRLVMEYGAR